MYSFFPLITRRIINWYLPHLSDTCAKRQIVLYSSGNKWRSLLRAGPPNPPRLLLYERDGLRHPRYRGGLRRGNFEGGRGRDKGGRTQRVAARQLRPLRVLGCQLVADAVEELHVALLRVLLERRDKGPGHSARSLLVDSCISAKGVLAKCSRLDLIDFRGAWRERKGGKAGNSWLYSRGPLPPNPFWVLLPNVTRRPRRKIAAYWPASWSRACEETEIC